jgi:hypothetical protein
MQNKQIIFSSKFHQLQLKSCVLSASVFNRLLILFNMRTEVRQIHYTGLYILEREKGGGNMYTQLFMHLGVSVR